MLSKRTMIAKLMAQSGALTLIERLPSAPQLIVITYHRIGNRYKTQFDSAVHSATPEAFDAQIIALKKRYAIVDEAEALDIAKSSRRPTGTAVLITFDDGYLDNFNLAMPVLRCHGVKGLFFLVTDYLSNPHQLPWWDRIAFLLRQCEGRDLVLTKPDRLAVKIDRENLLDTIKAALLRYRTVPLADAEVLMAEIEQCAQGVPPPPTHERLLMNWDEARGLRDAGMNIGLHTHSHSVLARHPLEQQRHEIHRGIELMRANLGMTPRSFAYPHGGYGTYTAETMRLVEQAGLEAAYSFYGGTNPIADFDRFDIRRISLIQDAGEIRMRASLARLRAAPWLVKPVRPVAAFGGSLKTT